MHAHLHDTPAHALPRVRARAQVRLRAPGRSWPSATGCKTASKKISFFSRFNSHARCAPTQTEPREFALFLRASVSGETYYNYFRTYQPNQGRYTQNDPIGLDGGWNRHVYAGANPLISIDPEGLLNSQVQGWLDRTRPDLSKCVTAECKAGLLPAPPENRTNDQIDQDLQKRGCKRICKSVVSNAAKMCMAPPGTGYVAGKAICYVVCD
jgi:RHS repeat-associated protein